MTERLKQLIKFSSFFFLAITLSACSVFSSSEEEEEEPVELKMMIKASDNINPSDMSKGNPVVLILYQLKSADAFKSAQILDLFEKDSLILAEDLVKRQSLASLLPEEKRSETLAIAQGTKYLAVFAQFSNYSQAKAKAWLEIKELDDIEHVTISIDSLTINIESTVEDSIWPW